MYNDVKIHYDSFVESIRKEAIDCLNKKLLKLEFDEFLLYEKTGNRLIYESKYFERRKYLVTYTLVLLFDKSEKYLKKLESVIAEICEEITWALPAHIDRKNQNWEKTIDLFSAETAQAMACIYDMLKNELSSQIKEKIKANVLNRVLLPYQNSHLKSHRFENMGNNWVSVCLGCIGSAAIYLNGESSIKEIDIENILKRVLYFLPNYFNGISDDGVCLEGLNYFTYGMVYYIGFAKQLKDYTEGKINLLKEEKLQKLAKFQQNCYLNGDMVASFSDGDSYGRFRLGLSLFLHKNFDDVELPDISYAMNFHTDHCYRFMANYQDIFWVREYLADKKIKKEKFTKDNKSKFIFYENAQWAIWKENNFGLAVKGGNNAEDHNHNDIGSFLFVADKEVYLSELGCGEYTKDYFGEKRYDLLNTRSLGHSVPLIDNKEQSAGKNYKTTYFKNISERNIKLSFACAYDDNPKFELTREIKPAKNGFTLIDILSSDENKELKENFVTQIEPIIIKKEKEIVPEYEVHLKTKSGSLIISGIFSPIDVKEELFNNHRGKAERVWLISFAVERIKNKSECSVLFSYERRKEDANNR